MKSKWIPRLLAISLLATAFLWLIQKFNIYQAGIIGVGLVAGLLVWLAFDTRHPT